MFQSKFVPAALGALLLCSAVSAQLNITIPQQAVGVEGNGATSYPWNPCLNTSCSIRSQYFYTRNAFLNQSVTGPILINQIRWRGDGGLVHAGGVVFPSVTVQLSTAAAGSILAPNAVFANNHGPDVATVFTGQVTTLATAGTSPNGFIVNITLTTPFLYDPNGGDLCVDISNQGGPAGGPAVDQITTLGADGARVWDFTPGATQQTPASGNNQPGLAIVMELGYAPPSGTPALLSNYGTGCVRANASVYENFGTAASFDLANTGVSMINGGNSYTVLNGINPFVAPSGGATVLTLGDDTETNVALSGTMPYPGGATNSLTVCSNGFVSTAAGNGTAFTPASNAFLAFPQTAWAAYWHDMNPGAGGTVTFEEVSGVAYVTFTNVVDFGLTSTNTFQFQFELASGNVHIVWQTTSGAGNGVLVGYSPGGPNADPGSTDLSVALGVGSITLTAADNLPLTLTSGSRPILGTTVNLTTGNIPAGAPFGAVLLGFVQFNPGVNLGPAMAGCFQYTNGSETLSFFGPANTHVLPFLIPNNNAFLGLNVFLQSAVYAPAANLTLLGAISSNGVAWTIGNV